MFRGVTLSTTNYDALLQGWNAQTLHTGVYFNGGNSKYCAGKPARANMISTYGWVITDGGYNCPPENDFVITVKTDNAGNLHRHTVHHPHLQRQGPTTTTWTATTTA